MYSSTVLAHKGEFFLSHLSTPSAESTGNLQIEVDAPVAGGETAGPADLAVVKDPVNFTAPAGDFFPLSDKPDELGFRIP